MGRSCFLTPKIIRSLSCPANEGSATCLHGEAPNSAGPILRNVRKFLDTTANRVLPLTVAAAAALKAHKKRQAEHRLSIGMKYHGEFDLVFPQLDGSPQDPANASRDWGGIK